MTASGRFVGRRAERALVGDVLARHARHACGVLVTAEAGGGKSALLEAIADDARQEGRAVRVLHGGRLPQDLDRLRTLLDHAVTQLGRGRLAGLLMVDALDEAGAAGQWLWRSWLPTVPKHLALLVSRRPGDDAPVGVGGQGRLWIHLPLGRLSTEESFELLATFGVQGERATALASRCDGHPLDLVLGAAGVAAVGQGSADAEGIWASIEPSLRPATLALAALGHVTNAWLSALARETPPAALSRIPGARAEGDGFTLHESLRDPLLAVARRLDPDGSAAVLDALRRVRIEAIRSGPIDDFASGFADIVRMHRDRPLIQMVFGAADAAGLILDRAREGEREEILAFLARLDGAAEARICGRWLDHPGGELRVARGGDDRWQGFLISALFDEMPDDLLAIDGLSAPLAEWMRSMFAAGRRVWLGRTWIDRGGHQLPGPVQTLFFLHFTTRHFLEGIGGLATAWRDLAPWEAVSDPYGARVVARVQRNATLEGWIGYDWRTRSPWEWLEAMSADFGRA